MSYLSCNCCNDLIDLNDFNDFYKSISNEQSEILNQFCEKCYYDNQIKFFIKNNYPLPTNIVKKFDTYYILYHNGDIKYECKYNGLKKDGVQILYYPNLNKKEECFYIQDQIEGYHEKWYLSGSLKYKCYYENNIKCGVCIYFSEDGEVLENLPK